MISILEDDAGHPDGLASNHFHDKISVGSIVEVSMPSGSFYLDGSVDRPIVLLAAGVGLTPMISMLETLAASRNEQKVVFVQCCVSDKEHPMRDNVDRLAASNKKIDAHVFYSRMT